MLATALGESSKDFSTAKGKKPPSFEVRTALRPVPTEALGSITAKSMRPMLWIRSLED